MKKILIGIAVVAVIGGLVFFATTKGSSQGSGNGTYGSEKGIQVEVRQIEKGEIASTVAVTGTVDEIEKEEVKASESIKVKELLVEEGDLVQKGQQLFTIDSSNLEEELEKTRLEREIQALQLEKLKNDDDSSNTQSYEIAVELAKIELANTQKNYDQLLETYEKNQDLYNEGIISEDELNQLSESVDAAKLQIDVAQLELERSESNLSDTHSTKKDADKSLSYEIEIQLKRLESTDLDISRMESEISDLNELSTAPINGTVMDLNIKAGDTIPMGSTLMDIVDLDQLVIKAYIREYDIGNMALNQEVDIVGDAIEGENAVKGHVSYIAPKADVITSGSSEATAVEINVDIDKGQELLKPGYTVDCEIFIQRVEDAVIGNFDIYREDENNKKLVYVVKGDKVEERSIEIGIKSDFDMEVTSGLEAGEWVVVNPSIVLSDGKLVSYTQKIETDQTESGNEDTGSEDGLLEEEGE